MRWVGQGRAAAVAQAGLVALGLGCHSKQRAVVEAGPRPDAAAPERAARARFKGPVAAVRQAGVTVVVARETATGGAVLALIEDGPSEMRTVSLGLLPLADEPELLESLGGLGLLVRQGSDAADARLLHRIVLTPDGLRPLEVSPVGSVACAAGGGVFSLVREGSGWKGSFSLLRSEKNDSTPLLLPGKAETTLICAQRRAFVATNADGEMRALVWDPAGREAPLALLPKLPDPSAEGEVLMTASDDQLVVARMGAGALETLVWSPGTPAPAHGWQRTPLAGGDDVVLEAIEPASGMLGLLMIRTVDAAKGCKGGDATDAVAEAAIVDTETGKLKHTPERIETWRCGAEPGPFFSGWARGKFVVGWPRGADAACAHAGVRHGGIGFAEIDPGGGHARVGRTGPPSDTLTEAGCEGERCFAVAITRGTDPCGPPDGPESGQLEVIAYPPPLPP